MYETRRASFGEFDIIADYWFMMATEMGEIDGIPKPDYQRVEEVKKLFVKENEAGNLMFRIAVDKNENIVACAGGLMRMEYSYPLAEEQSPFGWIITVYTLENHRNIGLAHKLVDEVCVWLKEKGANRARLWSSSNGKRIYENLGFKPMFDMSKTLT
ncbi:GNAT family N-acetyltransferase [Neobacillus vireti]|uniref:GNAT family N-acetyltransferase n=1 Tax=Neobacillus vireti TaxID=220686 RepID=UPI002FFF2E95